MFQYIAYILVAILAITIIYRRLAIPFTRPIHCKAWHRFFTWRSFELRGPIYEVGELRRVHFLGIRLWLTRFYRYDSTVTDHCLVPGCECKKVIAKDGEVLLNPFRRELTRIFKPWVLRETPPNVQIIHMQ